MELELVGALVFGFVIGYVAWRVFNSGEKSFGVTQLASFVGVLLGAAVLAVFPAKSGLFSYYSIGLGVGFFFSPFLTSIRSVTSNILDGMNLTYYPDHGSFNNQLDYINKNWALVERFIQVALSNSGGVVKQSQLLPLPLDDSGQMAAMKKFARLHPTQVRLKNTFLGLRILQISAQITTTKRKP